MNKNNTNGSGMLRHAVFGVGIILSIVFGLILIGNLIVILSTTSDPDDPLMMFGVMPLIVSSGSMSGEADDHIDAGDLIFVKDVEHQKLKVGDIVVYTENKIMVTHRIVSILTDENNRLSFVTKGDANNAADDPISSDRIIGVCKWRIPKLGRVISFFRTPAGIILCVAVPVMIFLIGNIGDRKERQN